MARDLDSANETIFAEYHWVRVDDNIITLGITEDGLEEIGEIESVELPSESTVVDTDDVIGEIETDDGPLQVYTPIRGTVIEVNTSLEENPDVVIEDPTGDGWLVRIEAEDPDELREFLRGSKDDDDDDLDDYDDDDDEEDDDDYDDESDDD